MARPAGFLEGRVSAGVGFRARVGVRGAEVKEEAADVTGWGTI